MKKISKKQINFLVIYGVVIRKNKNYIWLNYGLGKIKAYANKDLLKDIEVNYTVSVSGYPEQQIIRTAVMAQQISIFDKKPHYINLGD